MSSSISHHRYTAPLTSNYGHSSSSKRKATETLESDRTKKTSIGFQSRKKRVYSSLRVDLVCAFSRHTLTSLYESICQGQLVELEEMRLNSPRWKVTLLPRIDDPSEAGKRERKVIGSITSEKTGVNFFTQIFPPEVLQMEPLTQTLQNAIDCTERFNAKILSNESYTPEESNQAIRAHAKARVLIYFLMAHVFYDLHSSNANITFNRANLQIQRGVNGNESCHHSLFANLHNTSLLTLQDTFANALKRAVTETDAELDADLIIKLLSLGIEGRKIKEVISDVFEQPERIVKETQNRAHSYNPTWLDKRIGILFREIDKRSSLISSASQNIFNDRSNFTYLNNHTLVGWMVNPVDDYIEQEVRGVALNDLKKGYKPSQSAEKVGEIISSKLNDFIKNMTEIVPIISDTAQKYRAIETLAVRITRSESQELPFSTLEELDHANRELYKQNELLETKINNSLLPIKIKSLVTEYLKRSKAHVNTIAHQLVILHKADQKFSTEFQKQEKNELIDSTTKINNKIAQLDSEIIAIKTQIKKSKEPFQLKRINCDEEVRKLGWDQIYAGSPALETINASKHRIITNINRQNEPLKNFQHTLYRIWNENHKLLQLMQNKVSEKERCREELLQLEPLLKDKNDTISYRSNFCKFIKSDQEIKVGITQSYGLLRRYFLGLISQDPIKLDIGRQVQELIDVAEIQRKATQDIVQEIKESCQTDEEISKMVMPYLLLRGVDPIVAS